ncbi:hypothetical protein OAF98_04345 [Planctomicrobium sp.]|jgi:hypothetical protein|nr:hypothetical protein [Planctomicrobium sp.]MDB4731494.1 hypothetical protein [bacterium]MDB4743695.1 hypothetical protein [Planctomicrobium sp.]
MPTSTQPSNGELFLTTPANSLSDVEWLKTLQYRNSVPAEMKSAAEQGDVDSFIEFVRVTIGGPARIKKSQRRTLLSQLTLLQEKADQSEELTSALLDPDLKKAERSIRVEAFIAEQTDEIPETRTLCNALWILTFYREKLSSESLFSLWRWALQQGQLWMEERPVCDPEQGLNQLRFLEICLMMSAVFPELQGSRQLQKETIGLIRNCLDESTDNDGTPQAPWVPGLIDSLTILARLTLFSKVVEQKLWDKEYQKRMEGLIGRAACYCVGDHFSFSSHGDSLDYEKLTVIAKLLAGEDSGISRLWESTFNKKLVSSKKVSHWSLPDEVHQSDWSLLACMRSGWKVPVDSCVVLYDSSLPQIDVVVADVPLFQGSWSQELKIDGRVVNTSEDWTCTCWFADEEVNFIELQQEVDATTKVVRQIVFLREQHQLLINHAVHAHGSDKIEFQASLPFNGDWQVEQDTATRELAMQSLPLNESSSKRVRVYPLSLEQERVQKAAGKVVANEHSLSIQQSSSGEKLFASTMFDWSPQRMHKAVDWTKLAVAQDGQLESTESAVAFRCRVGRDQWLFYHSLSEPDIPRTIMGLHTPHETVFSKVTSKGEIEPIVEVEM